MAICPVKRNNMSQVMAHTGFGPVRMTIGGAMVQLPQDATHHGVITPLWAKRIKTQDLGALVQFGCIIIERKEVNP